MANDVSIARHEPVAKGIVRVARDNFDGAIGALNGPVSAEAIHEARVRLKRQRALAQVFRSADPEAVRRLRRQLRDAGRALAPLRAQTALIDAARDAGLAAPIMERLLDGRGGRANRAAALAHARRLLDSARDTLTCLTDGRIGRRELERALRRAARAAEAAFAAAGSDAESLHEWRKRLKDLGYLAKLAGRRLHPRKRLLALAEDAQRLLGAHHDLALLAAAIGSLGGTRADRDAITRRQHEIEREARALGERIAALPPLRLD